MTAKHLTVIKLFAMLLFMAIGLGLTAWFLTRATGISEADMSQKDLWQHITAILFSGLALIFFCLTVYLLMWPEKSGKPSISAVLAVFCALMGNPDRFETFKFSLTGIETKAREVLQQAQITLEQMQKLAASLAEGSLNDLAFSGQVFVGMPTSEKFQVHDKIVARLKEIGLSQDEIIKVQQVWIDFYCSILEKQIEDAALKALPNLDIKNEIAQIAKENGKNGLPEPKALKKWLAEKSLNDPAIGELMDAYESVWTTGTMINPDLILFGSMPRSSNER